MVSEGRAGAWPGLCAPAEAEVELSQSRAALAGSWEAAGAGAEGWQSSGGLLQCLVKLSSSNLHCLVCWAESSGRSL